MLPKNFLNSDSVITGTDVQSKKRLLEIVAELFATQNTQTDATNIFEKLVERERLGSAGLGKGIALPHARIDGIDEARAVFIKLDIPIDFDAIDKQPVDLVVALLVPENASEQHLQILAGLARFFSNEDNCVKLRETPGQELLANIIVNGIESSQQEFAISH